MIFAAPFCIYSHSQWERFSAFWPFGSRVRSLLVSDCSYHRDDVSFVARRFKLLRVFDLAGVRTSNFSTSIFSLVLLRFLALESFKPEIQYLIVSLPNLETFQLYGSTGESIHLENIRKFKKLRHLHISYALTLLSSCDETYEKSFHLDNLLSLSTLRLPHGDDAEKIMRCFPNLRKLKCIIPHSMDLSIDCNSFLGLGFLIKFESLHVLQGGGKLLYHYKFNFPENLKKLILSDLWLTWSQVSTIGQLPHLKVLKLLETKFEGETWEMNEGEFLKLKFLELESWNVEEWNVFEGHLPCLEQLLLTSCWLLNELPSCLEQVPTLQRLELRDCTYELKRSAVKVEEAQKEMGNDQLKLIMSAPCI